MDDSAMPNVRQLRVVVHVEDFDDAVGFYRDALGLEVAESYTSHGGAKVVILEAGRATLELSNTAQVSMIDDVEVGKAVSPHIRLAFEVTDASGATERLVQAGARLIAAPVVTPWRSLNSRLDGRGGIQLTLFQELG